MADTEEREQLTLRRVRGPQMVRVRGGTPVTPLGGPEDLDLGRHRWVTLVGIAAVAGLFLLASFAIGASFAGGDRSGSVTRVPVPRLDGSSLDAASRSLGGLGLLVAVDYEPNEAVPQGTVFGQRPVAGSKLEVGSEVTVVVSDGPAGVKVPDVKGFQQSEAVKLLQANQLNPAVQPAYDESVRPGEVLRTDPAAGIRSDPGAAVTVYVSNGPAPHTVPQIADQPIAQGFAALGRSGVGLGSVTTQTVSGKQPGVIVSTDPGAGTSVPRGFPVAVVVTPDGPNLTVPSVTGLLSSSATSALS
ncbi:MAG: PASTA domain-containing protein, partial [Actinobacteria bacterium]|nr:PASTA domain-containing protein [Actinomycetota bacterium]